MTIIGKLLAAGALLAGLLAAAPASAQNTTCPTAPPGTSNNQCASTAFVQNAVSGTGIIIGTTPVTNGTSGRVIFDNGGVAGEYPITGTGSVVLNAGPSIANLTVTGGLTATGLVTNADLANAATTVNGQTCTLGSTCTVTAAASGIIVGTTTISGGSTGRVEFNNAGVLGEYPITGSAGSVVLSTSPTIAGLTVTGSLTATGLVTNADLVSPTTTVNGTPCTLGSTCTITAVAGTITVGTTTVASGTSTRILYDNAGVLGEYTLTGSGTVAVMQTSPSLITPALGVATATSLAVNAATLGSNAVAAIGQVASFGATTTGPGFYTYLNGDTNARVAIGLDTSDIPRLSFGPGGSSARDTFFTRAGAAVMQLGAPNVNGAPVAQTLQVQSPLAGSASNTAGASWTIIGGLGTGTGTGGDIIIQTNVKTSTGTAQGTATSALTIKAETQQVQVMGGGSTSVPSLSIGASTRGFWSDSLDIYATVGSVTVGGWNSNGALFAGGTSSGAPPGLYLVNGDPSTTAATAALIYAGTGVLQIGRANVNGSPVAQTLQVQSPLAGSATNTAGANWTLIGGLGTGTGTGGDIVFQTNVKTTTGTAQGTATTAMTIKAETLAVNFAGPTNTTGTATWSGTLIAPIRTVTAAGAVTISAATDYYICVDKGTGAATTVNLPASPATGLTYVIKDCKGDAASNNITITPAAGNIDNTSTYVISTNLASVAVIYNGTGWFVF